MDDEYEVGTLKGGKMGADNNPTATSRLVALQTRKQALEEKITAKNKELRKLCLQEAELTGVMPAEIPLEPGETLPTFRRRVGTAFEYPQNIINSLNNEEESVPALETKIQVQKKIAEAALQLANNATKSKSIRRKNISLYRQTKQQLEFMEERLENLKTQGHSSQSQVSNNQNQQLKQKKKPRPILEADTISTKSSNPSQSDESSITRSSQSLSQREQNHVPNTNVDVERYIMANKYNTAYKNSNQYLLEGDLHNANIQNFNLPEDNLSPTLNRLSVNSSYISTNDGNRRLSENSSGSPYIQTTYAHSHSNPNIYQHQQQQQMFISNTHTLPHISHSSPNQYQASAAASQPNINFPVHAHTLQYPNSRMRYMPDEPSRKYTPEYFRNGFNQETHPYYTSHPFMMHSSSQNYKQYGLVEPNNYGNVVNSHHILSHQQYEPEVMSTAGLGGHWVKTENGDMVWCPSMQHDDVGSTWETDKRFGSLDRRKGKHIHNKRTSPNLDMVNKQGTMRPVLSSQQELATRPVTLPVVPNPVRPSRHNNRQLVRTQSLGSVGAQTVDSVWPSDDNSSYDSDGHSINELNAASRKLKQKGWCETSLDGPAVQHPASSREEIRISTQIPVSPHPSISSASPRTPKPILEIPAESNPSPMQGDTNIEMYNNNVLSDLPKNCTVVQAGQCKPYREVTKPFEMSDFYKYSTKFRNVEKSPTKTENVPEISRNQEPKYNSPQGGAQRSGQDNCESQEDLYQKGVYQPLQPMKCQPLSPANNFNRSFASLGSPVTEIENASLDSSLALNTSVSNVAEHFSAEMNAWYQNHGHGQTRIDGNNASTSPVSLGRSTATLV